MNARGSGNPDVEKCCQRCGKTFSVKWKERSRWKFCGHSCAASFHNERNPHVEKLIAAGTARAEKLRGTGTKHPYVKRNGRHEHRIVAEQKLGRALLPGEIVHHIDEVGKNNGPDNLDVLPSQAEHARLHFTGKKRAPLMFCKKHGHPLTPENVRLVGSSRTCLICSREYHARWYREKRLTQKDKENAHT